MVVVVIVGGGVNQPLVLVLVQESISELVIQHFPMITVVSVL